jgi:small subunit ribosomal protein S17
MQANTAKTKKVTRTFTGVVTSDKMSKTVVVQVDRTVMHPKYQKRYVRSQKYKVHDELNEAHVGDVVTFAECRPISRDKRWRLVKKNA